MYGKLLHVLLYIIISVVLHISPWRQLNDELNYEIK